MLKEYEYQNNNKIALKEVSNILYLEQNIKVLLFK